MTRIGRPWLHASAQLAALWAVVAVVHGVALLGMVSIWWRSDTFAHALLVPPIVAWLVWRQRHVLASMSPTPSAWGALPFAAGVLLAAMGELAQVNAAQHFGLVLMVQGAVWLVLGSAVTRRLAFPLLFLLFAPPFGEFLLPTMMGATADFTVAALRLTGVPVYREGLQFVIPSGHWSVVEACSGVRYLMASVMVGALFAYLNFNHWPKRLAFLLFATLMPLVANWVRAYLIVMLGHLSGNELATGADHLVYGWVFFGLIMMLMFWIGAKFADPLPEADLPSPAALPAVAHGAGAWPWPALLAALGMVAIGTWAQGLRDAPAAQDWNARLTKASLTLGEPDTAGPGLGSVAGADAAVRWQHRHEGGATVHVYVAYVAYQRQAARAVASTSVVVQPQDKAWQILSQERLQLAQDEVQQLRLRGRMPPFDAEWRARRLYWVDGWWGASEAEAKWRGLWQLARGRGDAAAMVVTVTRESPGASLALDAEWQRLRDPLNERLTALGTTPGPGHNAAP